MFEVKLDQGFKKTIDKWDSTLGDSIKEGLKRKKIQGDLELERADQDGFLIPKKRKENNLEQGEMAHKKLNDTASEGSEVDSALSNILKKHIGTFGGVEESKYAEEEGAASGEGDADGPEQKTNQNKAQTKPAEPKQTFKEIDLSHINSVEELEKLGADHLKHELVRLGLKCGGSPKERAERLWTIKKDPSNLFNPKFLAKK